MKNLTHSAACQQWGTCGGEEELAPGGVEERVGQEEECEERGVSVGGAGEWRSAGGDGSSGVGKD